MTMLSILSQLPRTIVLLLQPGDFTKFQTFRNRGFICNLILTNRFQGVNSENLSQGTFVYFILAVTVFLMAILPRTQRSFRS